jgi:hypothetical protein
MHAHLIHFNHYDFSSSGFSRLNLFDRIKYNNKICGSNGIKWSDSNSYKLSKYKFTEETLTSDNNNGNRTIISSINDNFFRYIIDTNRERIK